MILISSFANLVDEHLTAVGLFHGDGVHLAKHLGDDKILIKYFLHHIHLRTLEIWKIMMLSSGQGLVSTSWAEIFFLPASAQTGS